MALLGGVPPGLPPDRGMELILGTGDAPMPRSPRLTPCEALVRWGTCRAPDVAHRHARSWLDPTTAGHAASVVFAQKPDGTSRICYLSYAARPPPWDSLSTDIGVWCCSARIFRGAPKGRGFIVCCGLPGCCTGVVKVRLTAYAFQRAVACVCRCSVSRRACHAVLLPLSCLRRISVKQGGKIFHRSAVCADSRAVGTMRCS